MQFKERCHDKNRYHLLIIHGSYMIILIPQYTQATKNELQKKKKKLGTTKMKIGLRNE